MAEAKFSTFMMSETTLNQIKALPQEMQLKYFWAVADFGINGIEPKFDGVELAIWIPMRDLILNSKRQDEAWRDKQRRNGKKGGRPRKIPVNPETQNNPKNPGVIDETQKTQGFSEENPKTHNNNGNSNIKENGNGNTGFEKTQKPPPQILKTIISESLRLGFIIDQKKAVEIFNSGIDPVWYDGPYSFLALAAEKAKAGKYALKPPDEQKSIFISAVLSWDDLRVEYPLWLENQKRKDEEACLQKSRKTEEAKKKKKREAALEEKPSLCECGAVLDETLSCLKCKITYSFDETSMNYQPEPMSLFAIDYALKKRKEKNRRSPG